MHTFLLLALLPLFSAIPGINSGPLPTNERTGPAPTASLTYFSVEPQEDSLRITWVTEQEKEVRSYQLSFSDDGQHFEPVGSVTAFNTGHTVNFYQLVQRAPGATLTYYRLTAHFQNGETARLRTTRFLNGRIITTDH